MPSKKNIRSKKQTLSLPTFTGYESGHETPATKKKFVEDLIHFIESGFKRTLFTKALYQRLSNCFGHIAHFNIHGFYEAQFSTAETRVCFVRQCLSYPCPGSPAYTFSDVEAFLQDWMKRTGLLNRVQAEATETLRNQELAELARLQAKYPNASNQKIA